MRCSSRSRSNQWSLSQAFVSPNTPTHDDVPGTDTGLREWSACRRSPSAAPSSRSSTHRSTGTAQLTHVVRSIQGDKQNLCLHLRPVREIEVQLVLRRVPEGKTARALRNHRPPVADRRAYQVGYVLRVTNHLDLRTPFLFARCEHISRSSLNDEAPSYPPQAAP